MTVAEETDQEAADEPLLAHHDAAHFLGEWLDPGIGLLDAAIEFLDGWVHKVGWSVLLGVIRDARSVQRGGCVTK